MRPLAAVLCLLMGACASTTPWQTAAVGAATVDVATTLRGLNAGAQETNPILGQKPQRIILINAAILGSVWYFSKDLPIKEQNTIWKWVTALHLGAFAWNVAQGEQ